MDARQRAYARRDVPTQGRGQFRSGGGAVCFRRRRLALPEEVSKRRLPGTPIERIRGAGEGYPVEQALDVSGDAVRRHDERGVDGVDVAARHRSSRVSNQSGDRGLGEPKIVADTCEAVP